MKQPKTNFRSPREVLLWPIWEFPEITVVGRYKLNDQKFCYTYSSTTHALHVYEYHGHIKMGNEIYPISPGTLTFSPSGSVTSYDLPQPGYHYCVHFKLARIRATKKVELPLHFELGSLKGDVVHKINNISHYLKTLNRDEVNRFAAAAAMQELLLWLVSNNHRAQDNHKNSRAFQAVEQAANFLAQRIHQPLTVPELAEEVGLSQNYLARHFRQRFGVSIPRYLLMRRIEHAKHLLTTTNIPVNEISRRVGLPDPQHFYKQFRCIAGLSPSSFRLTQP